VCYYNNGIRRLAKSKKNARMGKPPAFFYTLTFTLEFQHDNDTVCVAVCFVFLGNDPIVFADIWRTATPTPTPRFVVICTVSRRTPSGDSTMTTPFNRYSYCPHSSNNAAPSSDALVSCLTFLLQLHPPPPNVQNNRRKLLRHHNHHGAQR
jgi:hypothetical protein